jgi:hypothetical protein
MLAAFNCSDHEQEILLTEREAGSWRLVLSTDDTRYGGIGRVAADASEEFAAVGVSIAAAAASSRFVSREEPEREQSPPPAALRPLPSWTAAVFTTESE